MEECRQLLFHRIYLPTCFSLRFLFKQFFIHILQVGRAIFFHAKVVTRAETMLRTEEPFCKQQRVENEFEGEHCLMALNLALFADLGFLNK